MGNLSIWYFRTMSPVGHTFPGRSCNFACSIDWWLRWSWGTWKQWTLYSHCSMWSCSFHRPRSRSSDCRSSPSWESCRGTHRIAWWKGPCSCWDPAACYTHRSAGPLRTCWGGRLSEPHSWHSCICFGKPTHCGARLSTRCRSNRRHRRRNPWGHRCKLRREGSVSRPQITSQCWSRNQPIAQSQVRHEPIKAEIRRQS